VTANLTSILFAQRGAGSRGLCRNNQISNLTKTSYNSLSLSLSLSLSTKKISTCRFSAKGGVFVHFDSLFNFNFVKGRTSMIGMRRKFL